MNCGTLNPSLHQYIKIGYRWLRVSGQCGQIWPMNWNRGPGLSVPAIDQPLNLVMASHLTCESNQCLVLSSHAIMAKRNTECERDNFLEIFFLKMNLIEICAILSARPVNHRRMAAAAALGCCTALRLVRSAAWQRENTN